jgi:hypothetical protein
MGAVIDSPVRRSSRVKFEPEPVDVGIIGPVRGCDEWIGPRRAGGTYLCGYWRLKYTVVWIGRREIKVRWEDGRCTTHCTSWDYCKDEVIQQPE